MKDAAATIAAGMMSYYVGNQYGQTPGILPGPYYWWEAGAMWGAMVNYWHYTDDTEPPGGMPYSGMGLQSLYGTIHAVLNRSGAGVWQRAHELARENPHGEIRESRSGKPIYWHGHGVCKTCRTLWELAEREYGQKMIDGRVYTWQNGIWITFCCLSLRW